MGYVPVIGSVVAYQTTPSSFLTGTSIFGMIPAGTQMIGSVTVLQGTNPWITTFSNSSLITTPGGNQSVSGTVLVNNGSVLAFQASTWPGSVLAVQGVWSGSVLSQQLGTNITSVVSSTPSSMLVGASIIGLTPVTAVVTGNPSISGTVLVNNGSVVAFQGGGWTTSLVSTVPSSVIVGSSIFGQLPAGTAVLGSVATLQGTNPWIETFSNSSIFALPVGSFIGIIQANSIVGTYAEDAGHTTGDKGVFIMGVRNDAMPSITSADLDYSPFAVGPVGENIVANAPINKWTSGATSIFYGPSVQVIAAGGTSIFTYITGVQVTNVGASSVLVTLFGGTDSVVGYTVAPQGGGSNIYYPNGLKTRENSAFSASISGVASVFLSAQGFISKT